MEEEDINNLSDLTDVMRINSPDRLAEESFIGSDECMSKELSESNYENNSVDTQKNI